jgi:hypothetical protein
MMDIFLKIIHFLFKSKNVTPTSPIGFLVAGKRYLPLVGQFIA